jgi:hypothetical protein
MKSAFSMNLESRISEFSELERELDESLRKLKAARDPSLRREILRKLRRLLSDADRILDSSILRVLIPRRGFTHQNRDRRLLR